MIDMAPVSRPKSIDEFDLMLAAAELRRFLFSQYKEIMRLSYPRMAAFAKEMSRGGIAMPTPTEADDVLESVARFYYSLRQIDQTILEGAYLPGGGTQKQQAKRASMSVKRLKRQLESLLRRCCLAIRAT